MLASIYIEVYIE